MLKVIKFIVLLPLKIATLPIIVALIASFAVFMVPNLAEWFILRLVDLRFLLWDYVCMK